VLLPLVAWNKVWLMVATSRLISSKG